MMDNNKALKAGRILEPQNAALPRHGAYGKCSSIIHADFDARLQTPYSDLLSPGTFS
jgi:hypothetical protein